MVTEEQFAALTERVAFLEGQLMKRVPEITVQGFLITGLLTWMCERHPDIDFDRISEEMMRSVDDLKIDTGSATRNERMRAMLSTEMADMLVVAREKVDHMRRG